MKKIISVILAISLLIGMGVLFGVEAEAVSLSEKKVNLIIGENTYIYLEGADSKKVEWSSDENKIATVKSGVIKGISAGKTTITAKYKGKSYKCTVNVTYYRIDRESSSVMVGNRLQLDLVGYSGARTWTSSDTSVATVSKDGILRGISAGKAKISVNFKKSSTISFNVTVKDYNFPVTASKTAYIKLGAEGSYNKEADGIPTKYITSKTKIKSIIKYADGLKYEFVEPSEAEEIAAKGYALGKENTVPEELIFYDADGGELGRFETALVDAVENNDEKILGYFHYNQKCYRVKDSSNLMNEIYDWKSHKELKDIAEKYFKEKYGKRIYKTITSEFSYNKDHPDYKTTNGISFIADYNCSGTSTADYITIYIDPRTGKVKGSEELSDDIAPEESDSNAGRITVRNTRTGVTYTSNDNGKTWTNGNKPPIYAYAAKTQVSQKNGKAKFVIVNNSQDTIAFTTDGEIEKNGNSLYHVGEQIRQLIGPGNTYEVIQYFSLYNYDFNIGRVDSIITKGEYNYNVKAGGYEITVTFEIV